MFQTRCRRVSRALPSAAVGFEAALRAAPDRVHPVDLAAAPIAEHFVVARRGAVRLRDEAGLERGDWLDGLRVAHDFEVRARMIAALKNGMSSGLRDVMRLPSSTTGLSTYMPPAFLTSTAIDGQHVSVLPRTAFAEIRSDGA